jgi:hypothetical protein
MLVMLRFASSIGNNVPAAAFPVGEPLFACVPSLSTSDA